MQNQIHFLPTNSAFGLPLYICIVGEETYKSKWIEWEINKAVDLKKKIIAVKTAKDNTTPAGLYGVGATWALSFTFEAIKKALDDA